MYCYELNYVLLRFLTNPIRKKQDEWVQWYQINSTSDLPSNWILSADFLDDLFSKYLQTVDHTERSDCLYLSTMFMQSLTKYQREKLLSMFGMGQDPGRIILINGHNSVWYQIIYLKMLSTTKCIYFNKHIISFRFLNTVNCSNQVKGGCKFEFF